MLGQSANPVRQLALLVVISTLTASTAYAQWTTPPVNAPGVQQRLFHSQAAGQTVSYHIFLPPEYNANAFQRFPVLFWLHGSGAGTLGIPPLSQFYANAIESKLIPPMLIVFPNGMQNSMWSDAASGDVPMESVVINDLIAQVDANFRTLPKREGRIIEGFSMGGYGAARLGLKHNHLFTGISILAAGPMQLDFLDPPPGAGISWPLRLQIFEEVWGSDPNLYFIQSPWNIAQQNAQQVIDASVTIRLAVGQLDLIVQPNLDFQTHLDSLNIPHTFYFPPNIDHSPMQLLLALGPQNWIFYNDAFANIGNGSCLGDIADDFGTVGADGQVSFGDFLALLGLIGPCPGGTPGCTGDIADDFGTLGADGQVSFGDFLALLGLIGPCP
jgi:enterochelin esterase-like enzyme